MYNLGEHRKGEWKGSGDCQTVLGKGLSGDNWEVGK